MSVLNPAAKEAAAEVTSEDLGQAIQCHLRGELERARELYVRAAAVQGFHPEALHGLGMVLCQQGDYEQGIRKLEESLRGCPEHSRWKADLGLALLKAGRLSEAEAALLQAWNIEPARLDLLDLLGGLRIRRQDWQGLSALYRTACDRSPLQAVLHDRLGAALMRTDDLEGAVRAFETAAALDRENPVYEAHRGAALVETWDLAEAIRCLRSALERDAKNADAWCHLAMATLRLGDADVAWSSILKASELDSADATVRREMLRIALFRYGATAREIAALNASAAETLDRFDPPPVIPGPRRTLRVGYVSGLLIEHETVMRPFLAAAHAGLHEVFVYADRFGIASSAHDMPACVNEWRNTDALSGRELAELIGRDDLDVLVDCDGYARAQRLGVIRSGQARARASLLNHPAPVGVPEIPFRITDRQVEPQEYVDDEACLHIASFACFSAPSYAPEPTSDPGPEPAAEPPSASSGCVVFGSFSRSTKLTPPVYDLWAKILHETKDSRLVIHHSVPAAAFDAVAGRIKNLFSLRGIAPSRLEIIGSMPLARHLELYRSIDIALDPFPYNGMLTTMHALWMGVPVIALSGQTWAGRVGLSLLHAAGLPEYAVSSETEYLALAVTLATDATRLRQARAGLRTRLQQSMLMDQSGYARELDRVYRNISDAKTSLVS